MRTHIKHRHSSSTISLWKLSSPLDKMFSKHSNSSLRQLMISPNDIFIFAQMETLSASREEAIISLVSKSSETAIYNKV